MAQGARYKAKVKQRNDLLAQATAVFDAATKEKRDPTAEENQRFDELMAEHDSVQAEVVRWEQLFERERTETAASSAGPATVQDAGPFKTFGEMLQAVAVVGYPGAGSIFGSQEVETMRNKLMAYQAAASGMSVGVPQDGGYLVRHDWTTDMLARAVQKSTLFPLCREIKIGAGFDGLEYPFIDEVSRADGQRWGGVQVFWKAEAATVANKQPKIGKGDLRLEELMGIAFATERLLKDSSALQGVLTNGFESEFGFKLDDSIIRGSGAGQMLGILTAPALVTVAAEGGQTADTVNQANISKMYARMPPRSLANARWFLNQEVSPQLDALTLGNFPIYLPNQSLASAPYGTLKGRPIQPLEQCSAIGDVGDIIFADFSEYLVITKDGEGLRYDQSMHIKFLTDEMAFRWVYRVNGQPIARSAITPYKGSATISPFIALAAR